MLYSEVFSYCWISLINQSWISPTLQKGWELEFCLFFKKWGGVHLSPKKGEVVKIVEEWRLLRENNLCLLADFCVINPRNITILGIYIKVTSFIIFLNFWDKVLNKIISYILDIASHFRNRHLYQNLACGAHFLFKDHDLFENVEWN